MVLPNQWRLCSRGRVLPAALTGPPRQRGCAPATGPGTVPATRPASAARSRRTPPPSAPAAAASPAAKRPRTGCPAPRGDAPARARLRAVAAAARPGRTAAPRRCRRRSPAGRGRCSWVRLHCRWRWARDGLPAEGRAGSDTAAGAVVTGGHRDAGGDELAVGQVAEVDRQARGDTAVGAGVVADRRVPQGVGRDQEGVGAVAIALAVVAHAGGQAQPG